jgi:hypothetical protein
MRALLTQAVLFALLLGVCPGLAAERLKVDGTAGNNTLTAIFDEPLGERITAVSSAVACDASWEPKDGPCLRAVPGTAHLHQSGRR